MKNLTIKTISIVFVSVFALFSMGYAGWFGFGDDKSESKSESPPAAYEETRPGSDMITLSGTINGMSQLVDDKGEAYEVSESTDQGMRVKSLIGKKVEIKGTVMEQEGMNSVEVKEYKILRE